MKTSLLISLILLLASISAHSAEAGGAPGSIRFSKAEVSQVLPIYRAMAGRELVVDSRVKTVRHTITLEAQAAGKEEGAKLIEKALLNQAGVVITRLDGKRASVTYNDALPIAPAKTASSN